MNNKVIDKELAGMLGLSDGQMRDQPWHTNLWWSFDHDRTFFGYGDLDKDDLERIYNFLRHPCNQDRVFTAWNEHHGSEFQQINYPIVRISFAAGITYPYSAMLAARYNLQ